MIDKYTNCRHEGNNAYSEFTPIDGKKIGDNEFMFVRRCNAQAFQITINRMRDTMFNTLKNSGKFKTQKECRDFCRKAVNKERDFEIIKLGMYYFNFLSIIKHLKE